MLKKSLLVLSFGLLSIPIMSLAATLVPSVYVVRLTDGGKVLDKQSIALLPGKTARFSDEKTANYVLGSFSTGVFGKLRVSVKHPNVLRLNVSYTSLVGMQPFVVDGHTIDQPVLQNHTFVDFVDFRNRKSITLNSNTNGKAVFLTVTKVS